MFFHLVFRRYVFHLVVHVLCKCVCDILQWHAVVFCSTGKLLVAVRRFLTKFACLLSLLWLPSWEEVVISLFLIHSIRVFVVNEQLFDRLCHFLYRLSLLTVWGVGVVLHITNCRSFFVQVVQKLFRHIRWVFKEIWEWFRVGFGSEFMPFPFCCGLWFWSDVFLSEWYEYVFKCSFIATIDVLKCS